MDQPVDVETAVAQGIPGGRALPSLSRSSRVIALLVGVNEYSHVKSLSGCERDVQAISSWLETLYDEPHHDVRILLNAEATGDNIRKVFKEHLIKNPGFEPGDAIFFYFAGHGSTLPAPPNWPTPNENIELICPSDHNNPDATSLPAITDIEFASMLRDLAYQRGNNITIMLDCCHSGGGNRNTDDYRCCESRTYRGISFALPFGAKFHASDSHVLIASCRPEEVASDGNSFTQKFLSYIKEVGIDTVKSYVELETIVVNKYQHPVVEGFARYRPLFSAPERSFVPPLELLERGLLLVGKFHGITDNTQFELHRGEDVLGPFGVENGSLRATSCSLKLPEDQLVTGTIVVVKEWGNSPVKIARSGISNHLGMHFDDLLPLDTNGILDSVTVVRAPNTDEADIIVIIIDESHIRLDIRYKSHDYPGPTYEIMPDNKEKLRLAIGFAARFFMHLVRENLPTNCSTEVRLHSLTIDNNELGDVIPIHEGRAGVREGECFNYGMKIANNNAYDLYCYLLIFDCVTHSIAQYYVPHSDIGTRPLKANRDLTIGIGSEAPYPIRFQRRRDNPTYKTSDFFKLLFSTQYTHVAPILQGAPIPVTEKKRQVATPKRSSIPDKWATAYVAVDVN